MSPSRRQWPACGSGSDGGRNVPTTRRVAPETDRSECGREAQQPVRRGDDEARSEDQRTTAEPGHVHGPVARFERTSRLAVAVGSPGLRLREEFTDAILSRQADDG